MFEVLKNALSVAIGFVIGQFVYDEINALRLRLQYKEYDDEAREKEWEESWERKWKDEEDDDE